MTIAATDLQSAKLNDLANKLKLTRYDLLLIGDGAGTTLGMPCGFGCVAYDSQSQTATLYKGGFNHGTNNFAELMPFVHALWCDFYVQPKNIRDWTLNSTRYVEIVSDSELTVKQGNHLYARNANLLLWAAINKCESLGYFIHWNHVLRNTNEFNTLCDKIAKAEKQKQLDGTTGVR
jgi:ribonuclease HI